MKTGWKEGRMADCTYRSATGLVDWRALVHQAQMSATPQPVGPVKKLFTAAGRRLRLHNLSSQSTISFRVVYLPPVD